MSTSRIWATAVMAAALVSGPALAPTAFAADTDNAPANTANASTAANHDFGKLSQDGFKALRDIRLTRLAIFNGDVEQAKQDIDNASDSLQKAQNDDSIYSKAEADLKTPTGMPQHDQTNNASATTPIKWLPVDGAFALDEDYLATPDKTKAVAAADTQMKQGNHAQAMEQLKLAHVNVVFDVEVAPLEKTIAGVDKAKQLIGGGQYFEANQELKTVESGMRYDVEDLLATPQPKTTGQSG